MTGMKGRPLRSRGVETSRQGCVGPADAPGRATGTPRPSTIRTTEADDRSRPRAGRARHDNPNEPSQRSRQPLGRKFLPPTPAHGRAKCTHDHGANHYPHDRCRCGRAPRIPHGRQFPSVRRRAWHAPPPRGPNQPTRGCENFAQPACLCENRYLSRVVKPLWQRDPCSPARPPTSIGLRSCFSADRQRNNLRHQTDFA
jgi:hypothetical protein